MRCFVLPYRSLRTLCKIALFAVLVAALAAFALPPRADAAGRCLNYCARFCPQYLAQYCVSWPDGYRSTIWTNPCFACNQRYCVLYLGECKPVIPPLPPPPCKGTKCK